jgi:hypothetical protein
LKITIYIIKISLSELKNYLRFNYKSITDNELIKLLNLNRLVGTAKFLRSEYAFRKNYTESNIVLNSSITENARIPYNLIKFLEYEMLPLNEMKLYKNLNSVSYVLKKELDLKVKNIKLPWKLKIYFVNSKIMTEEEYHDYRDSIYTQPT